MTAPSVTYARAALEAAARAMATAERDGPFGKEFELAGQWWRAATTYRANGVHRMELVRLPPPPPDPAAQPAGALRPVYAPPSQWF